MAHKPLTRIVIAVLIIALLAITTGPGAVVASSAVQTISPWTAWTSYAVGALVSYNSVNYQALQNHTSQPGWEPPNVPALWKVYTGSVATNTPTRTPTRTNTPTGPTATPTRTPTRTNTPVGPTFTPTRTPTRTNTPVAPTNTPTRTNTPSGVGCWTAWVSTTAYNGGAQVSRNGQNYQAAYWTQGNDPATSSGPAGSGQPWIPMGACGGGSTATFTPTRTNTPVGPTFTPTRTPTNTQPGPTVTPCASCGLAKHILVGYWHNFDNGTGYIRLRNVSTKWDVINVSFGEPTNGTAGGTIGFTPYNATVAEFQSDVAYLKSIGKKVVLSIGGANGQVQLSSITARDNFINSVTSIINTYGFDGLDIDFEGHSLELNQGDTDFMNPTTPVIVNTIYAIRAVRNNFGSNFILTMAPETFFVQLGYQFYGGTCLSCDRRAGAYLPVIYATRDILSWLQVQDYNSGSIMGLDNNYYSMGSPDFHSAMLDMTLAGFPVAGTGKTFPALRQDQIVLGIPAASGAGGGYMPFGEVQKSLNYVIKGQSYGGAYVLRNPGGYPNMRGVMTWSINWDAFTGFVFSDSYRTYLNSLP